MRARVVSHAVAPGLEAPRWPACSLVRLAEDPLGALGPPHPPSVPQGGDGRPDLERAFDFVAAFAHVGVHRKRKRTAAPAGAPDIVAV